MPDWGETFSANNAILPVQITSSQRTASISHDNSVGIQHRNYFENELLPQLLQNDRHRKIRLKFNLFITILLLWNFWQNLLLFIDGILLRHEMEYLLVHWGWARLKNPKHRAWSKMKVFLQDELGQSRRFQISTNGDIFF